MIGRTSEIEALREAAAADRSRFVVAFERVCMWHERELKAALGITGVSANICAWRSSRREGGAQFV